MTDVDLIEISGLCARQFGGHQEQHLEAFTDWGNRFRPISKDDAERVIMELAASDTCPARPSGRFLARHIIAKCLGAPLVSLRKKTDQDFPDCDKCRKTGMVTVPHPKDWTAGGEFWKGEYECVVACMCEAGERFRNNHRTLENYEREFTNWRQEYPLRYLERRRELDIPGARQELEEFFKRQPAEDSATVVDDQAGPKGDEHVNIEEAEEFSFSGGDAEENGQDESY